MTQAFVQGCFLVAPGLGSPGPHCQEWQDHRSLTALPGRPASHSFYQKRTQAFLVPISLPDPSGTPLICPPVLILLHSKPLGAGQAPPRADGRLPRKSSLGPSHGETGSLTPFLLACGRTIACAHVHAVGAGHASFWRKQFVSKAFLIGLHLFPPERGQSGGKSDSTALSVHCDALNS